jgi:hypothetical protein
VNLVFGIELELLIAADYCSELPAIVELGFDVNMKRDEEISMNAHKTSDFVWAVRLTKISKGLIDRQWSVETFSSGATFGINDGAKKGQVIINTIRAEGFESIEIEKEVDIEADDEVFIIGADNGEPTTE